MDCCNYMQYRQHSTGYYGSHYYDPLPPSPAAYHADLYPQPFYQDYYGTPPYYQHHQQQWHCNPFTDYVYNPKEARLRKAMRDASRGGSPMVPRPNARRPPLWMTPHEEQLMMSPMSNVRASMESSVCNFSMSASGVNHSHSHGQYMNPMSAYSKVDSQMPPTSMQPEYMQETPLSQLQQQQHNMWHTFSDPDPVTSCSPGAPFMVPEGKPSTYPSSMAHAKETSSSPIVSTNNNSQHHRQPQPDESLMEGTMEDTSMMPPVALGPPSADQMQHSSSQMSHSDCRENEVTQSQPSEKDTIFSSPAYNENVPSDLPDQRREKSKKSTSSSGTLSRATTSITNTTTTHHSNSSANMRPPSKALPDFNEAFGSTERGRFQSPPDPRLLSGKPYIDYFFDTSLFKFQHYQD